MAYSYEDKLAETGDPNPPPLPGPLPPQHDDPRSEPMIRIVKVGQTGLAEMTVDFDARTISEQDARSRMETVYGAPRDRQVRTDPYSPPPGRGSKPTPL